MALSPYDSNGSEEAALNGARADAAYGMPSKPGLTLPPGGFGNPPASQEAQDYLGALNAEIQRKTAPVAPPAQAKPKGIVGYNPTSREVFSNGHTFSMANATEAYNYMQNGWFDVANDPNGMPPGFVPIAPDILKTKLNDIATNGRSNWDTTKEVASGLKRGFTQGIPAMGANIARFTGANLDIPEVVDWANKKQTEWALNDKPADLLGRGKVAATTILGAENAAPSLSAVLVGVISKSPALTAAITGGLFGASQGGETYRKGIEAGLSHEDALSAANKNAAIEAGGETIATYAAERAVSAVGGLLSGLVNSGKITTEQAIARATDPTWVSKALLDLAENTAVQYGTEVGQGYGEAAVEKQAKIDDKDPWEVGIESGNQSLVLSAFLAPFGGVGGVSAANYRAGLGRAMNDPSNPTDMLKASKIVADSIKENVGEQEANAWLENHVKTSLDKYAYDTAPVGSTKDMFSNAYTAPLNNEPVANVYTDGTATPSLSPLPGVTEATVPLVTKYSDNTKRKELLDTDAIKGDGNPLQGSLFVDNKPAKGVVSTKAAPATPLTAVDQIREQYGITTKSKYANGFIEEVLKDQGDSLIAPEEAEAIFKAYAEAGTDDKRRGRVIQQYVEVRKTRANPMEFPATTSEQPSIEATTAEQPSIEATTKLPITEESSAEEVTTFARDYSKKLLAGIAKSDLDALFLQKGKRNEADTGWELNSKGEEMVPTSSRAASALIGRDHQTIINRSKRALERIYKAAERLGIPAKAAERIVGIQGEPIGDIKTASKGTAAGSGLSFRNDGDSWTGAKKVTAESDDLDTTAENFVPDQQLDAEIGLENKPVDEEQAQTTEVDEAPDLADTTQEPENTELTEDQIDETSVADTVDSERVSSDVDSVKRSSALQELIAANPAKYQAAAEEWNDNLEEGEKRFEELGPGQQRNWVKAYDLFKKGEITPGKLDTIQVRTLDALDSGIRYSLNSNSKISSAEILRKFKSAFKNPDTATIYELKVSYFPKLIAMGKKLSRMGYDLSVLDRFYAGHLQDDSHAVVGKMRDGKYRIIFDIAYLDRVLKGKDEFYEFIDRVVAHEAFHAIEDVSKQAIISSRGIFYRGGYVDRYLRYEANFNSNAETRLWVSKMFGYPLSSNYNDMRDQTFQGELFAQVMSAFVAAPNMLRTALPELYTLARKTHEYITGQTYYNSTDSRGIFEIESGTYKLESSDSSNSGGISEGERGNNRNVDRTKYIGYTIPDSEIRETSEQDGEGFRESENITGGGKPPTNSDIFNSMSGAESGPFAPKVIKSAADSSSLVGEWLKRKTETVILGGMFGHDFAALAADKVPSIKKYFTAVSDRMVERARQEQTIDQILRDADDKLNDREKDSVNKFLIKSQYEFGGSYYKQPSWMLNEDPVSINADFKAEYDQLSSEQQEIADRVFEEGFRQWEAVQDAFEEAMPAGSKLSRAKLDGLYVTLKRIGDYVVTAKSQEYVAKEKDYATGDKAKRAEAGTWLEANKTDDSHYYVSFHDTEWDALKERQELQNNNPDMVVKAAAAEFRPEGLGEMQYQTYIRLQEMIENYKMDDKAKAKALRSVAQALYIQSLNQNHALKSNLRRQRIKGANKDALRVFASQGRANAMLVSSLRTTRPLQQALQASRGEVSTPEDRRIVNELLKRHAAMTSYRPTPIQDMLTSYSSVHFLLTSPAFYLQNMTQPFMVSLPMVAGKHGYAKSWSAFLTAWKETTNVVKPYKLHTGKFELLGFSDGEQRVLSYLTDRNLIDIGVAAELSDFADKSVLPRPMRKVIRKLRTVATRIETINRMSTALAAYRLELAEQLNRGKPNSEAHSLATDYAEKVILDTHGDYSGYNAPRYFMQGGSALPIKVMVQFRKFQIIQISLLTKLAKQAFYGATAEEKAVARASLSFLLAQIGVMTGGLGLPIAQILAGMGVDDGDDKEAKLRRLIGDKDLATLILHGAPAVAGLDLTNKLGWGNTFDPTAFINTGATAEDTLKNYAAALVGGPSAAIAMRMMQGYDQMFSKGQYWAGMEKLLPTGVTNLSKAIRFQEKGVTTGRGDVVLSPEDISALDSIMQGAGLPTTIITDRQWKGTAAYTQDSYFRGKTIELTTKYANAIRDKDSEEASDIRKQWNELQAERKAVGYTQQPLSTLLRAPFMQAKRERSAVGGLETNKQNKKYISNLNDL